MNSLNEKIVMMIGVRLSIEHTKRYRDILGINHFRYDTVLESELREKISTVENRNIRRSLKKLYDEHLDANYI